MLGKRTTEDSGLEGPKQQPERAYHKVNRQREERLKELLDSGQDPGED